MKILKHPVGTEKAIRLLDQNNLVFMVDRRAKKPEIKSAIEKMFDVKIEVVRTVITTKGKKKAYIKLKPDFLAVDIATSLGLL
ncbi:MAG: 50S ribosomal protein L23 [Candidatus Altiarchaeota archaeon]|nr:50S ribosomal protein L23 [Candidatus Altiarchaeota archaeon]